MDEKKILEAESRFSLLIRQFTEQENAREELQRALQQEKELNEIKSRFVSLASHEFKTPLSVILSSISLIEKYNAPELSENRTRHIQRIKSNVGNLRQILNDFLSLEKLENGLVRNNPLPVDLVRFAEDLVQDMKEACQPRQEILLKIAGIPRIVAIDNLLLRNILNNLLSNAIKYSPEALPVHLFLEFNEDFIRFTIEDSGIGIPADEQSHLFERFFRASNTSGISGTGLGLSIVKKYIDLMGGRIIMASEPQKGTAFTILLRDEAILELA